MPGKDDQGVLLSRGSVARIKRVVDRFEGPSPPTGSAVGATPGWNPGIQRAKVTTAVPTGTIASPSSTGKVKIQVKGADGSWADGPEVTCYNDMSMSASLPVGRAVKVAWIAGDYWLVSASCS